MKNLTAIKYNSIKVLTTKQLAEAYGVKTDIIGYNFRYNKTRYTEGKHYIMLEGQELRTFKSTNVEIQRSLPRISRLYLWTEKGALLHAKSLNTDKAWQVYDYLVDFYFRANNKKKPPKKEVVPTKTKVEPFEEELDIPEMKNPLGVLRVLLKMADEKDIRVASYPFQKVNSAVCDRTIGVKNGLDLERICYEIAWELSHLFIHYDNGNIIKSPLAKDYNDQASRAATMLIKAIDMN